jgi:hypothetical protein
MGTASLQQKVLNDRVDIFFIHVLYTKSLSKSTCIYVGIYCRKRVVLTFFVGVLSSSSPFCKHKDHSVVSKIWSYCVLFVLFMYIPMIQTGCGIKCDLFLSPSVSNKQVVCSVGEEEVGGAFAVATCCHVPGLSPAPITDLKACNIQADTDSPERILPTSTAVVLSPNSSVQVRFPFTV